MANAQMSDRTIAGDSLATHKLLTFVYNTAITECSNENLRRDFFSIYQDEQNNLYNIFKAMSARGWYQTNMADQQDITQVQQNFKNMLGAQAAQMGQPVQAPFAPGTRPMV